MKEITDRLKQTMQVLGRIAYEKYAETPLERRTKGVMYILNRLDAYPENIQLGDEHIDYAQSIMRELVKAEKNPFLDIPKLSPKSLPKEVYPSYLLAQAVLNGKVSHKGSIKQWIAAFRKQVRLYGQLAGIYPFTTRILEKSEGSSHLPEAKEVVPFMDVANYVCGLFESAGATTLTPNAVNPICKFEGLNQRLTSHSIMDHRIITAKNMDFAEVGIYIEDKLVLKICDDPLLWPEEEILKVQNWIKEQEDTD